MTLSKLRQCAEGLVITAVGLVFALLSLGIRNNPVPVAGFLNFVVQAKFIPLLLSVLIMLQGLILAIAQWRGREMTSMERGFTPRALTLVFLTAAYLVLVSYVGFLIPTVVYIGALLFVANRGLTLWKLLALTALYSVVALMLIPGLLNLQLL